MNLRNIQNIVFLELAMDTPSRDEPHGNSPGNERGSEEFFFLVEVLIDIRLIVYAPDDLRNRSINKQMTFREKKNAICMGAGGYLNLSQ